MPHARNRRRLTATVVAVAVLTVTPLAVTATDSFTDVPTSNVHHDDVGWLADSGVTRGCNPPANDEFCPEQPVRRDQMSSFMRRLAEGKVVDAATAVEAETAVEAQIAADADRLGGQEPAAYQTLVAGAACGVNATVTATSCGPNSDGTLPNQTTVEVLELDVDVPADGILEVSAHTIGLTFAWVAMDETCVAFTTDQTDLTAQAVSGLLLTSNGNTSSATALTSVPAGAHTLRMCVAYPGTDDNGIILIGNLGVRWTAGGALDVQTGGSDSATPLDLPQLSR